MQGRSKLKHLCVLLIPLIAACTTPERAREFEVGPRLQSEQVGNFDNCSVGCPSGGSPLTLVRQAYTLNNNSSTKFANWVSYKITKASPASGRPRNWRTDPDIPAGKHLIPWTITVRTLPSRLTAGIRQISPRWAVFPTGKPLIIFQTSRLRNQNSTKVPGLVWRIRKGVSARIRLLTKSMSLQVLFMRSSLGRFQERTRLTPFRADTGRSFSWAPHLKTGCTHRS